jgi:hypothetical protein
MLPERGKRSSLPAPRWQWPLAVYNRLGLARVVRGRVYIDPGLDRVDCVTEVAELLVVMRQRKVGHAGNHLLVAEELNRRHVIVDRLLGVAGPVMGDRPQ